MKVIRRLSAGLVTKITRSGSSASFDSLCSTTTTGSLSSCSTATGHYYNKPSSDVNPVVHWLNVGPANCSYEGEVDWQRILNGYGLMVTKDFIYIGEWSQNRPQGYGIYYNTQARFMYEGQFENGDAHGFGRLTIHCGMGAQQHNSSSGVDNNNNSNCYYYGRFDQGRQSRRRSFNARNDRDKSVQAISHARRAAAATVLHVQPSYRTQKSLHQAAYRFMSRQSSAEDVVDHITSMTTTTSATSTAASNSIGCGVVESAFGPLCVRLASQTIFVHSMAVRTYSC